MDYKKGIIVVVNLSDRSVSRVDYDDQFSHSFLGGRGFNAAVLSRYAGECTGSPYDSENVICVSAGLLAGTNWPSSGRTTVSVLKSPVTGLFADGNLGGYFGPALRLLGVDALVILGKSEIPTTIHIVNQGDVKFYEFPDITYGNSSTQALLKSQLGDTIKVLSIGSAGGNQVFCSTVSCGLRFAGGGGTGAVFGSKNLKAICVEDRMNSLYDVLASNQFEFDMLSVEATRKIESHPVFNMFRKYGTTSLVGIHAAIKYLPTKNWTRRFTKKWKRISGDAVLKAAIKSNPNYFSDCEALVEAGELGCRNCPVMCSNPQKIEYETLNNLGTKLSIFDLDAIINLNTVYFNDAGLDVIQATSIISTLMEMYEDGVSDYKFVWGDIKHIRGFLSDLISQQNSNRTIGKYFSNGFEDGLRKAYADNKIWMSLPLNEIIKKYFVSTKGNAFSGVYPSASSKGVALAVATSSRGADHLRSLPTLSTYASWYFKKSFFKKVFSIVSIPLKAFSFLKSDAVFLFGDLFDTYEKTFGVPRDVVNEWKELGFLFDDKSYKGWGSMVKYCQELYAVSDALGICRFTTSWRFGLGPEILVKAVNALLGTSMGWRDLLVVGERIYALERSLLGDACGDDNLPERFFCGKQSLDKEKFFSELLHDYYLRCNYNTSDGRPTTVSMATLFSGFNGSGLSNDEALRPFRTWSNFNSD